MRSRAGSSLVLYVALFASCYAAEPDSGADTNTNWLQKCTKTSDCDGGDKCVDGWCMSKTSTSAEPPNAAPRVPADASFDAQALGGDGLGGDGLGDAGLTGLSLAPGPALFELRDQELRAGTEPVVGWEDDRALVAWAETPARSAPAIKLARVTREGDVTLSSMNYGSPAISERIDLFLADRRLAVARSTADCSLESFTTDLVSRGVTSPPIPCRGDGRRLVVSPIADSGDWTIAFRSEQSFGPGVDTAEVVSAGRVFASTGWAVDKLFGAMAEEDHLGIFTTGNDVVVAWGGAAGTRVSMGRNLARPNLPDGASAQWSEPMPVGADAGDGSRVVGPDGYRFADLGESKLLFGREGSSFWMYSLAPDGSTRATYTSNVNGPSTVAAAKELGIAGVCFAVGPNDVPLSSDLQPAPGTPRSSVWFATVDGDGSLSPPVAVVDDLPFAAGCSVAWTGTQFLAVAWGILQEVTPEMTTLFRMRGVLIDPSELR